MSKYQYTLYFISYFYFLASYHSQYEQYCPQYLQLVQILPEEALYRCYVFFYIMFETITIICYEFSVICIHFCSEHIWAMWGICLEKWVVMMVAGEYLCTLYSLSV